MLRVVDGLFRVCVGFCLRLRTVEFADGGPMAQVAGGAAEVVGSLEGVFLCSTDFPVALREYLGSLEGAGVLRVDARAFDLEVVRFPASFAAVEHWWGDGPVGDLPAVAAAAVETAAPGDPVTESAGAVYRTRVNFGGQICNFYRTRGNFYM